MLIGGLQKTTLIDYPGRLACTVFTIGCNFRCPFCHNRDLVSLQNFKKSRNQLINQQSIFSFLESRKKILEGVCITGGEPTLQPDLPDFCRKIKNLGMKVKLDSNGSNPEILSSLIEKKLIDYVAMDIKSRFADYEKTAGAKINLNNIQKSIQIILQSGLEYEFRTTIVPGLHNLQNLTQLAQELKSLLPASYRLPLRYFLQSFRPQNCLDIKFLKIKPFTVPQLQKILISTQKFLPETILR